MKKSRMIQDYLLDILDAMDKAAMFTDCLDLEGFCKDDKTEIGRASWRERL